MEVRRRLHGRFTSRGRIGFLVFRSHFAVLPTLTLALATAFWISGELRWLRPRGPTGRKT